MKARVGGIDAGISSLVMGQGGFRLIQKDSKQSMLRFAVISSLLMTLFIGTFVFEKLRSVKGLLAEGNDRVTENAIVILVGTPNISSPRIKPDLRSFIIGEVIT